MWQSISYFAALAVESLIGVFGIRLYEEARYDVIDRIGDRVEIRRYGPRLVAEVDLAVAGEAGRSEAFRLLFAYIAGANRALVSGSDNRHYRAGRSERQGKASNDSSSSNLGNQRYAENAVPFAREIQPRKRAEAP